METRARALLEEYRFVYRKIQHYMWNYSAGSGMDMTGIFKDLLGLFEDGAANDRHILEVTGKDIAAFCDDLLRNARTYTENWREALNRDIQKKFGKGNGSK